MERGQAPGSSCGALRASRYGVGRRAADAVFHLIAARALFCASVFETGRLSIPGCIGIDAGQLTGKGERVQNQSTQHAPWLGAGLSAVPEIALTRAFSLELGVGLRVLGQTNHFVFQPGVPVHDVPRFSWDLGLGISMRPY